MKKIFGISLVALLVPMVAHADAANVNKDPGATVPSENLVSDTVNDTITADANPRYALKPAAPETDGNIATARYVKGAYNAVIKGINAVQDEYADAYDDFDGITDGYATQSGVLATIEAATATGASISSSTVTLNTSATLDSSKTSVTASGTLTANFTMMDDWQSDAAADSTLQVASTFSNKAVTVTALGTNANTVTTGLSATKTGITLDISAPAAYVPGA